MIRWSTKEEWDALWAERGQNNPPEGVIMIGSSTLTLPPDHDTLGP